MAVQPASGHTGNHQSAKGRVLSGVKHGGHVLDAQAAAEAPAELAEQPQITTAAQAGVPAIEASTPFDYMFGQLAQSWPAAHLPIDDPAPVVAALEALGAAMVEDPPPAPDPLTQPENSVIPPIYTYWGQFIDHDMTANTDRNSAVSDITVDPFVPLKPEFVAEYLANLRHPALNLDSVYGDGPTFDPANPTQAQAFYDGIKFKIGPISLEPLPGRNPIAGENFVDGDLEHDVPRVDATALIGDGRNDENLIVAQLHTAFLRFHNRVVDWVIANEPQHTGDEAIFARTRQLVQFHYQWLVVHDYLETVTVNGAADRVLFSDTHLYEPGYDEAYMPLEYSVAVFRFGHSMVRGAYDYNRNFGAPGKVIPNAPFNLLFAFTGKATPPFRGDTNTLPFNWVIEWDRFVDKGSSSPAHFARRIDTRLAPPLKDLANEGAGTTGHIQEILKRLATRNLLRGYLLAIPTGQKVAAAMGLPVLTAAELQQGNSQAINDALAQAGLLDHTPLWYYVLKEAEVKANGNSLGEVGSRIVCETIIGQIRNDPDSYYNADGHWMPDQGVKFANGDPITTIGDLLKFAGLTV